MKHNTQQRAIELAIEEVLSADGCQMVCECSECGSDILSDAIRVDRNQLERLAIAVIEASERWQRQHRREAMPCA